MGKETFWGSQFLQMSFFLKAEGCFPPNKELGRMIFFIFVLGLLPVFTKGGGPIFTSFVPLLAMSSSLIFEPVGIGDKH